MVITSSADRSCVSIGNERSDMVPYRCRMLHPRSGLRRNDGGSKEQQRERWTGIVSAHRRPSTFAVCSNNNDGFTGRRRLWIDCVYPFKISLH